MTRPEHGLASKLVTAFFDTLSHNQSKENHNAETEEAVALAVNLLVNMLGTTLNERLKTALVARNKRMVILQDLADKLKGSCLKAIEAEKEDV